MSSPKINTSPVETACFRSGSIASVFQGTFPDAIQAACRLAHKPLPPPNGGMKSHRPDTPENWTLPCRK